MEKKILPLAEITKVEYLAPDIESFEQIVEELKPISASALGLFDRCPRAYETSLERGLKKKKKSQRMYAGNALHLALDYYYATGDHEASLAVMEDFWEAPDTEPLPAESHLTLPHMTGVFLNYITNYKNDNRHTPISVTWDDLHLDDVIGMRLRMIGDKIILGESTIVMRFDTRHGDLILSGHPDVPIIDQSDFTLVMDHKTTSGYLSDWFFDLHALSNKLRGYVGMMSKLLNRRIHGGMINAIYVGKYALNPKSTATKFERRYFRWEDSQIQEALDNAASKIETMQLYRDNNYWPQGCDRCTNPLLCGAPLELRAIEEEQYYTINKVDRLLKE